MGQAYWRGKIEKRSCREGHGLEKVSQGLMQSQVCTWVMCHKSIACCHHMDVLFLTHARRWRDGDRKYVLIEPRVCTWTMWHVNIALLSWRGFYFVFVLFLTSWIFLAWAWRWKGGQHRELKRKKLIGKGLEAKEYFLVSNAITSLNLNNLFINIKVDEVNVVCLIMGLFLV